MSSAVNPHQGSSFINKSGKRIVPKAAPRRRPPQNAIQNYSTPTPETPPIESPVIGPVVTATEVLEAQTQIQEEAITGADKPSHEEVAADHGEGIAALQDELEAGTLLNDLDESIPTDPQVEETDRRSKRRRLNDTQPAKAPTFRITDRSAVQQRPLATPSPSQDEVMASAVLSSSRTASKRSTHTSQNQLPTPSATQNTRTSRRRKEAPVAQPAVNDEPSTASTIPFQTIEVEEEIVNDDNWVITTQEEVRKKSSGSKSHRSKQPKGKQRAKSIPSIEELVTGANRLRTARSARIANQEKRRKRKQAIEGALAAPTVEDASGQDEEGNDAEVDNGIIEDNVEDGNDNVIENANENEEQEEENEESKRSKKIRKPRQRADTPDESETVTIVPSVVTMYELAARDRRTGMKSERERKMKTIDWDLVKVRRREEEIRLANERGRRRNMITPDPEDEEDEEGLEGEALDAAIARAAAKNAAKGRGNTLRVRAVNGLHMIDEQSQRVDRHALANDDMEALEEIDEEELTQQFNSHTYVHLKRRDPAERIPSKDRWDRYTTDKFYDCLARFGTDFMIISKMFPGRTRRQIKAKFVREERSNFARVQEALKGEIESERLTWDLEVFREGAGLELSEFKDPRVVEAELSAMRAEREKDIEAQKKETEEIKRQRILAGDFSEEEEEEDESGETRKKKNEPRRVVGDDELEEVEEFE
jgi:transcription factor TFIIIB component B''